MGLPRTFVGFSSADIRSYWLMLAWKANERIDFDFTDCQLPDAIDSNDEAYVKRRLRERINMAGTYAMLIGEDTRYQHRFVRWEAQVAIEKKCRLIAVNLDGAKGKTAKCPAVLDGAGAMFVPFSPAILAHALRDFRRETTGDWHYPQALYRALGY